MISREEKAKIISALKEESEKACIAFIASHKELNSNDFQKIRENLGKAGIGKCIVLKNTLARIAFGEKLEPLSNPLILKGANLLVLGWGEDPSASIKAFEKVQKELSAEKVAIKCGFLVQEGTFLERSEVKEIANLPTKEELLAQIAGALTGGVSGVAASINQIIGSIGELSVKVAEQKSA